MGPDVRGGITRSGAVMHLHRQGFDRAFCGQRLYEYDWRENWERLPVCGRCEPPLPGRSEG